MRHLKISVIGAIALFASALASALAYEFSPIVAVFSPSGAGAVRTFVVHNTQPETVALQIGAVRRFQHEDGTESREPELEDFIITPPQMVVAPGGRQTVRAQWIGDPSPDSELAYRFIVTQAPIRYQREVQPDTIANVTLGYRYEAAVYVTPNGAAPRARIIRAAPVVGDDGIVRLALTIESFGETRAILENPVVVVADAQGGAVTLEGEAVRLLENLNILAGSRLTVNVDWPSGLAEGPVEASITTRYYIAR